MRVTINIGLICLTAALCAFLKYFAGPVTMAKEQQEFVLNMIMLGGSNGRLPLKPGPLKLKYVSPIWNPPPPDQIEP